MKKDHDGFIRMEERKERWFILVQILMAAKLP